MVRGYTYRHMETDRRLGVRRPQRTERLIALGCDLLSAGVERRVFSPRRRELLALARGRVLDVGAGTGADLPHFPWQSGQQLDVVLLDPSAGMLERAHRKATRLGLSVQLVDRGAEELPFPGETFDTVVFALTLCTISNPGSALREAHRVLRQAGRLLVFEHVRAREPELARWQDRFDPLWKTINNGCHLNRDTRAAIERAGFEFERIDEFRERQIPLAIVQPQFIAVGRKRD
jgi:ubiquinone/menaquinone biosynthesis C-methylase UbiE